MRTNQPFFPHILGIFFFFLEMGGVWSGIQQNSLFPWTCCYAVGTLLHTHTHMLQYGFSGAASLPSSPFSYTQKKGSSNKKKGKKRREEGREKGERRRPLWEIEKQQREKEEEEEEEEEEATKRRILDHLSKNLSSSSTWPPRRSWDGVGCSSLSVTFFKVPAKSIIYAVLSYMSYDCFHTNLWKRLGGKKHV